MCAVNDVEEFLVRGSKKIIDHYRYLLDRTPSKKERDLYQARIEREQVLLNRLLENVLERRAA
jgi:hypothetical protein